ncbi:tripartite ATP-independent periplasmic transporter solute receptor, DctP family [Sphaerochaeta pleomorpha str. Grapes]|uniref:Tripartite ATP-independent periplasmic transporter solute receptor, DctP family n=1 Tax=Sphaerochaeta pleomorpha (strain ATCC BAA-1885 / DSM 22778 / Grapes) TaxID=158190 RepID=G8QTV8_SPHPG|nr:TRAP transporter substrate-binding protein [Sphaerochaeta pleomorpha]AEV29134.1 tripartite ATP-independent periplasmic transporter solute receptor, DctP family [Sphaerochaeta pleomorpha str. Grapes]
MKKILSVLAVLVVCTTMVFAQGKTETASVAESVKPITLTVYSPGNANSVPTKTILKYKELVEKASNGQILLEAHHSGELGNDAEALQSTRMGTIDVIFAGTSGFTSFYDKAKILDLPFLFKNANQAYEIVNSEIGEQIFADMASVGLVYLSEGDNGMRHIATTKKPVHSVADVKGLKIRVPTSKMYLDVWSALGATPVALALNELAIALSNGTAEAQDNATYHLVANATYDDIKYYSYTNYMWMGCTMAMNAKSWKGLTADQQKILKDQAIAAAKYSFDTIQTDNETAEATLKAAGVQFDANVDIQSFKDKLGGSAYYKQYAQESWYNQSIIDAILAK